MAGKSYTVARGQIEKGKDVIAKAGDKYAPKNKAEADRLIAAGVLIDPDAKKGGAAPMAPSNPPTPPPQNPTNPPAGNGNGGSGDEGDGKEGGNLDLGGGNANQS